MTQRRHVLALLAGIGVGGASSSQASEEHNAWVANALQRMLTVKTGMTRADLRRIFTTEGGISTPRQRTYVSRDCPYFKVDFRFELADGQATLAERDGDVISEISRPYLQFTIAD